MAFWKIINRRGNGSDIPFKYWLFKIYTWKRPKQRPLQGHDGGSERNFIRVYKVSSFSLVIHF